MSGAEYVEAKYVEGPTGANMPVATASAPPIVVLATDQPPPIVVLATDQPPPPPYAEPETDALFYTSPTAETDAELAARLQAEEGMLPGPPASRVVVVESKYARPRRNLPVSLRNIRVAPASPPRPVVSTESPLERLRTGTTAPFPSCRPFSSSASSHHARSCRASRRATRASSPSRRRASRCARRGAAAAGERWSRSAR